MSNMLLRSASALLVFLALSCSSPNEENLPLHAPGYTTPIATGIVVTGTAGETLGVWGTPSDSPDGMPLSFIGNTPSQYGFSHPYPNPHDGICSIGFYVPQESRVSLWVVKARLATDPNDDLFLSANGTVVAPHSLPVTELLHNKLLSAGSYRENWNATDRQALRTGFYRIYMKAGDFLSWRDMFLYRSLNDLPPDLREIRSPRWKY